MWCVAQADVARAIKEECEGELAVAMPILEDALAALDTIKEADITYIRKLGNPPGAIKLVMEVCHCSIAHACQCLCSMLVSSSSVSACYFVHAPANATLPCCQADIHRYYSG